MMEHLLSLILFLPLAGMLLLMLIPSERKDLVRLWANGVLLAGFLISLLLVTNYDRGAGGYQFVERASWIPSIGASYLIGIDGISLLMVLLTTLIGFLAVLSSWNAIQDRVKEYYALFLLLQTALIGVFVSLDFFLFYIFFELVLIPMYFIIGIWGGQRRLYAAIKFFLYTLTGSVLMLLGILTLYFQYRTQFGVYTFEVTRLMTLKMTPEVEMWVFWALFIGFAIKIPMFPFHTWLPDAHVQCADGGFGCAGQRDAEDGNVWVPAFFSAACPTRFLNALGHVKTMVALSIIAILYGALVSLVQSDWKRLVAYSSVSHLGFCTLGIFALNANGIAGSILQQVNHGISTGMLFLIVGVAYERRHSTSIGDYGGLASVMPNFAVVFAIALWSSAALPLLNGFVGEFTILSGAFQANVIWAALASLGVVLSAAYLLWLYQRVMLGEVKNEANRLLPDLSLREWAVFVPLITLAFWIGIYPKPYFDVLAKPVQSIVERVQGK